MKMNHGKIGVSNRFHVIPEYFFAPLSSTNRLVYWECFCEIPVVVRYVILAISGTGVL